MHLKRNIAACAGVLLVLLLGVAMVCAGCRSGEAEWDYTGTFGLGDSTVASTDATENQIPTGTQSVPETTDGPEETTQPATENTLPGNNQTGTNDQAGNNTQTGTNTGTAAPEPTTGTETTESTETTEPTGSTESTEPTEATESTEATEATEATEPGVPAPLTWEEYQALSGAEQVAYYKSFADPKDFFAWEQAAKKAYDEAHPKETIGPDGNIDLH